MRWIVLTNLEKNFCRRCDNPLGKQIAKVFQFIRTINTPVNRQGCQSFQRQNVFRTQVQRDSASGSNCAVSTSDQEYLPE